MSPSVFRSTPRPHVLIVLALLLAAPALHAQEAHRAAGHWKGAIKLPGTELAIDIDLARSGENWSGDISIPQQGARDLPLANVRVASDSVAFEIAGVPGNPSFRGVLAPNGGGIAGAFTQGGQSFTFALERAADPAAAAADALAGFDEWVAEAMKDWLVPGLALGVVRDGQVILARGFGQRDVEQKLPVTTRTLFAIGSSTKAFTTFALGRLVDQGKLEWDAPVTRYIPELRLQDEYATAHLTPRDMVTHRSGLPRHDLAWYNNAELDPAALVSRMPAFGSSKGLREEFQYNNMMYALAGHLVSRLTGKSWEDAVRDLIFQPLGMNSSNFSVFASQKAADFAEPYGEKNDSLLRLPFRPIDTGIGPAGSINSNIEDMIRWLLLHLNSGKAGGTQLLGKSTLDELHTPQIALRAVPAEPELSPPSYAMGWFVDGYRGHLRVAHGGNIDGFSALVALFPRAATGVVVLSNKSATPLPEIVVRNLADRLFAMPVKDWNAELLAKRKAGRAVQKEGEKRAPAERRAGTRPAHPLAEYAGEYAHPGYGTLTIEHSANRLVMSYNRIETPLEHWHYEVFNGLENPADRTFRNFKIMFLTNLEGEVDGVSAPFEPLVESVMFKRRPDAQLSDPAYLQRLVGTYSLGSAQATFTVKGSVLTVTVPGQPTYELLPARNNTFRLKGVTGYSVRFTLDAKGQVVEAVFKQPNGIFPARRVEPK
ncbi:MAG: serine hydrolase [Gemmatimonadetes bacterium]|nr:serine hydrolase [Gemmatimonadota bacterium]